MPRVSQTTWPDVMASLPECTPWQSEANRTVDLLIAAAGFEERSRAILRRENWPSPTKILVVEYPTNTEDNDSTLAAFRNIGAACTIVRYNRKRLVEDVRVHLDQLAGTEVKQIVLDISGMSSYVFFGVMSAMLSHSTDTRLTIFYAEAAHYFPSRADVEGLETALGDADDLVEKLEVFERNNFQSRGIGAIYDSELFPGRNIGDLPTKLVVIPNFSRDRTETMISYAQGLYNARREDVVWLIGRPPDTTKNGWRVDGMSRLYYRGNIGFPVSTLHYKEISRKLGELWEEFEGRFHMVIITLGSKMQHVGTYLFLRTHDDVGLILSEPGAFVADRFSKGVGQVWSVDLGPVGELKRKLSERGKLVFGWAG